MDDATRNGTAVHVPAPADRHNGQVSPEKTAATALEACLIGFIPHLRAFLRWLDLPPDRREDVLQDTILQALRYIRSGRAGAVRRPEAWLRQIASNLVTNNARRSRQHAPLDGIDPAILASDEMEAAEQHELLRAAVERLSSPHRELVVFCYLEGGTYAAASMRFDMPTGTISKRLAEAKRLLAALLHHAVE